jgi:hypothetical protein
LLDDRLQRRKIAKGRISDPVLHDTSDQYPLSWRAIGSFGKQHAGNHVGSEKFIDAVPHGQRKDSQQDYDYELLSGAAGLTPVGTSHGTIIRSILIGTVSRHFRGENECDSHRIHCVWRC